VLAVAVGMLDVAPHKEVVSAAFEAARQRFAVQLPLCMDQAVVEKVELALGHTRKPETWVVGHSHGSRVSVVGMPYRAGWH